MRTLSLSLIGTLILLLGGSTVAMATDEPVAGSEPIVVTGTLECLGDAPSTTESTSTEAETGGDGVVHLHRWVASDPRLEGEVSYTGRWQLYGEPAEDSGVPDDPDDALYAIVNEGGSWLCEASRNPIPPQSTTDRQTLVFDGEGDYEGLTAYLQVDLSQAPYAFTGLILPGEEPPYAEPQG